MSAPRSAAQKRPTPARKVTAKTEANRRRALDNGVRISLDGEIYTLRAADITPVLARELRRETGHSFMELVTLLCNAPDLDVIAEAVWVGRRMTGDVVDLDDIALDYGSLGDGFDIKLTDADSSEEVEDSPEA